MHTAGSTQGARCARSTPVAFYSAARFACVLAAAALLAACASAPKRTAIERDAGAGAAAKFKRIYLIDVRDRDADGYVDKELLVDLMDIANPGGLGDLGDPFTFPYLTIEDVELVDADTIAVLNDNNYPGTDGRGPGVKDVSEFLQIDLPVPLHVDDRLLPEASPIGGR
jgi:hypothetical protein